MRIRPNGSTEGGKMISLRKQGGRRSMRRLILYAMFFCPAESIAKKKQRSGVARYAEMRYFEDGVHARIKEAWPAAGRL